MVTRPQREAAAHLHQVYRVSQRRALQAIGVDRNSVSYRRRRPDGLAVRGGLREIALPCLHILLRGEG